MAQARPTGRFGAASLRARMSLLGREYAFAEVESGHSAVFLAHDRCAVHS
jgi:hypothetical protein